MKNCVLTKITCGLRCSETNNFDHDIYKCNTLTIVRLVRNCKVTGWSTILRKATCGTTWFKVDIPTALITDTFLTRKQFGLVFRDKMAEEARTEPVEDPLDGKKMNWKDYRARQTGNTAAWLLRIYYWKPLFDRVPPGTRPCIDVAYPRLLVVSSTIHP